MRARAPLLLAMLQDGAPLEHFKEITFQVHRSRSMTTQPTNARSECARRVRHAARHNDQEPADRFLGATRALAAAITALVAERAERDKLVLVCWRSWRQEGPHGVFCRLQLPPIFTRDARENFCGAVEQQRTFSKPNDPPQTTMQIMEVHTR